jgi:hypothetical protein
MTTKDLTARNSTVVLGHTNLNSLKDLAEDLNGKLIISI